MSVAEIAWQGPNHRLVLSEGQYCWQEWVRWDARNIGSWRACEETDLMAELRRRILDERTPPRVEPTWVRWEVVRTFNPAPSVDARVVRRSTLSVEIRNREVPELGGQWVPASDATHHEVLRESDWGGVGETGPRMTNAEALAFDPGQLYRRLDGQPLDQFLDYVFRRHFWHFAHAAGRGGAYVRFLEKDEPVHCCSRESPFTREEFVQAELQAAYECNAPDEFDGPTLAAVKKRIDWNADAAERAGVVWRTVEPATQPAWIPEGNDGPSEEMGFGPPDVPLPNPIESERLVNRAAVDADNPIIADVTTPDGMRTVYHAIEERVKDEIRALIREEVAGLERRIAEVELATGSTGHGGDWLRRRINHTVAGSEMWNDLSESAQAAHGRLQTHDRRLTELERIGDSDLKRVGELELEIKKRALLWVEGTVRRHEGQVFDLFGKIADLDSVVRRLDSDMALIRDAVCPPQGALDPRVEGRSWSANMKAARGEATEQTDGFTRWWNSVSTATPQRHRISHGRAQPNDLISVAASAWNAALTWYAGHNRVEPSRGAGDGPEPEHFDPDCQPI